MTWKTRLEAHAVLWFYSGVLGFVVFFLILFFQVQKTMQIVYIMHI